MKERELQAADAATLDQRETALLSELEDTSVKLEDAYQSLFNLRFRRATRQLEDTSQLRKARKEIARLKTADREMRFELAVIDAVRRDRAG